MGGVGGRSRNARRTRDGCPLLGDRARPQRLAQPGDRLREIAKLGFEKALVPRANQPKAKIAGLDVLAVERVDQAVQLLRNL